MLKHVDQWLTKQAAAEYLAISIRRLEEIIKLRYWLTEKRKVPGRRQAATMIRLCDLEAHKANPTRSFSDLTDRISQLLDVQVRLIQRLDDACASFKRFAERRDGTAPHSASKRASSSVHDGGDRDHRARAWRSKPEAK